MRQLESSRVAFIQRARTVCNIGVDSQIEKKCSEWYVTKCCVDPAWRLLSPCGHFVCDHVQICLCGKKIEEVRVFPDTALHQKFLRARRHFNSRKSETPQKSTRGREQNMSPKSASKKTVRVLELESTGGRCPSPDLSSVDEDEDLSENALSRKDRDDDYVPDQPVDISPNKTLQRYTRSKSKTFQLRRTRSCGDVRCDDVSDDGDSALLDKEMTLSLVEEGPAKKVHWECTRDHSSSPNRSFKEKDRSYKPHRRLDFLPNSLERYDTRDRAKTLRLERIRSLGDVTESHDEMRTTTKCGRSVLVVDYTEKFPDEEATIENPRTPKRSPQKPTQDSSKRTHSRPSTPKKFRQKEDVPAVQSMSGVEENLSGGLRAAKKTRSQSSTPKKVHQNDDVCADQSKRCIEENSNCSVRASKKTRSRSFTPRKVHQNDDVFAGLSMPDIEENLSCGMRASKKTRSQPSTPKTVQQNNNVSAGQSMPGVEESLSCGVRSPGPEDLTFPIKEESLEHVVAFEAARKISEFVNRPALDQTSSLPGTNQLLPCAFASPDEPLPPSTQSSQLMPSSGFVDGEPSASPRPNCVDQPSRLFLGDDPKNWELLRTYTCSLLETLRQSSKSTLAGLAMKALPAEAKFSNLSPVSDVSSQREEDFLKASTIKASSGLYSTGGEARKKLFSDELQNGELAIPSSQAENDLESEDIVFATPPTRKRVAEKAEETPQKRVKLDLTCETEVIQNTEEERVPKKSSLVLPLEGRLSTLICHLTPSPLRNILNLPELDVRCSALKDWAYEKKINDFLKLASETHIVRPFRQDMSSRVTHLIANTSSPTPKFLKAVYQGIQIIYYQWVLDSLEQRRILPEGPYIVREGGRPLGIFRLTLFMLENLDKKTYDIVKDLLEYCSCEIATSKQDFVEKIVSGRYLRGVIVDREAGKVHNDGCVSSYRVPCTWVYNSINSCQLADPVE